MADLGVLGLGSGAASSLNQETIDKLKAADTKANIEPIEKKLETWDAENAKMDEIEASVNKLKDAMANLTLSTDGTNVFESMAASTTTTSTNGTASAVFNANDVSNLSPGTINVYVQQLAKSETSYSDGIADKDAEIEASGTFTITHQDTAYNFDTTGKTYQELADEINQSNKFIASIEQVAEDGDSKYKLVIKSADTGTANALEFSSSGLAGTSIDAENGGITELQAAEDFIGKIDGLDYVRSSNTLTLQGNLTMTAVAVDTGSYDDGTNSSTTLTLERDSSLVIPAVDEFVNAYNELQNLVNGELTNEESPIYDKSALRSMLSGIKDQLFTSFGDDGKTAFDLGFEVDSSGNLSVNDTTFAEALKDDFNGIKDFFLGTEGSDGIIGTDDDESGLGTSLYNLLDSYDSYNGLLTIYDQSMDDRKSTLEEELAKAQEDIDARYALMATQFAEYGAIINQMEASFSSMKMTIDQSTSGD